MPALQRKCTLFRSVKYFEKKNDFGKIACKNRPEGAIDE